MPSNYKNTGDHHFLATDNLSDCAANIAYWLGQVSTPGGEVFTADAVATVPVTIQGFSTGQTGDLLDIFQNSAGNALLKISTISGAGTGLQLTSAAAGSGVSLSVLSSGANDGLTIKPKGTGSIVINGGGTTPGAALTVTGVNSGVNGLTVTNAATGSPILLSASGTDANIGINITTKGSGGFLFLTQSSGFAVFDIIPSGTVVNRVRVTATATGVAPIVSAVGSDTNVGLSLVPQGTGTVTITGGAAASPGTALTIVGVSTAVNGVTITNSATGSAPVIASTGTDANIGLQLNAKGTGATVINAGVALPAAGSVASGVQIGANLLGLFVGSGAPTFTAPQGSIYLRSDGSSTSTRAYINTNGAGTWTNVTTAA